MGEKIIFPDRAPQWVMERDCVAFTAIRGSITYTCLATVELLMERFGARGPSQEELVQTYIRHKPALQAIARALILAGQVNPGNEVLLTTETYGLQRVTFDNRVRQSGVLFFLARKATARLEEILGPSAEQVAADWERAEDGQGRGLLILRLRDWTGAVSAVFTPTELESASQMQSRLH